MRRRTPTVVAVLAAVAAVAWSATAAVAGPGDTRASHAHHDGADAHVHPRDLAEVRGAVARYQHPRQAQAAGWDLVPGLDHCFERAGVGGMGYHYIDTDALGDPTLDPRRPEALVYVPSRDGGLRLGAVEFIVPTDLWQEADPPSVLGHELQVLEPVPGVQVWALHVWVGRNNPTGIFSDWNPKVSCDNA
jgi:hypothetical protein